MNYLAIIVAAIASFIVGMLWYSPALFGKQWMKYTGMTDKKAKQGSMATSMILGFITTLVMACVLSMLLGMTGGMGVAAGAMLAFWIWLGFFATVAMGAVLWEKKPWGLYFLNIGYALVNLLVMGIIIGAWA